MRTGDYYQYRLERETETGTLATVCWLEMRLRPGMLVELRGEPGWWIVTSAGSIRLAEPPQKDWRVGGLEVISDFQAGEIDRIRTALASLCLP